jgi:2-octaprenyl-6-methoxyphenol hydroxylase
MSSSAEPTLRARVLGGGPTGALAALALAQAGWRVELRDPLSTEALQGRRRAYAFTQSSRRLLERLDLWSALAPQLVPFSQLRLRDVALDRWVAFSPDDLADSRSRGPQPVGWIGRHSQLMALLLSRLAQHPAVTLQLGEALAPGLVPPLGFDPGPGPGAGRGRAAAPPGEGSGFKRQRLDRRPSAAASLDRPAAALPPPESPPDLIVAADGPASPAREALGIRCWGWTYSQSCLTAEVDLRGAAPGTAWELLRPEGPSALLPLGEGRFQLVWSAATARQRRREALAPAAFLDALTALLPSELEPDALPEPPRTFPVGWMLAHRLSRGRTVLVGESAHRCHPVGGQGLNLCWRDVAVLHRLALRAAGGQLAPARIGRAYGLRRWPDLLLILTSTDLLVRLFSTRHSLALLLRRPALALLRRAAPLRRISLAVMTDGLPDLRRR